MKVNLTTFFLFVTILFSCKNDTTLKSECKNCNAEITNPFIVKNMKEIINFYKHKRFPPYNCTVEIRSYKTEKKYYFKNGKPFKNQKIIGYLEVDSVKFYIADTLDNSFKILKPISKELKIETLGFTFEGSMMLNYEPLNFIFNIKNEKIDTIQKMIMGY